MVQFGLITFNRGPYASPENLAQFAQQGEELGYQFLAVNDHVVIPYVSPPGHGDKSVGNTMNYFDPLMTMMYLGGLTKRIRIGTSVLILPYRPPVQTAKALATLDVFLGGRLFVGVGAGWWPQEFEALGIGDQLAERGDRTDEYLSIFKHLWSEAKPAFKGKFYSFSEIEFSPKPVQAGGPQIWIGGNKGRALRRMAEVGDVWHPTGTHIQGTDPAEFLGRGRAKLVELMEKAGRDPGQLQIAVRATVRITPNGSEPGDAFTGPAGHLVETVQAFKAQGLTHLALYFAGETEGRPFSQVLEQMQQIAEEVVPHCA